MVFNICVGVSVRISFPLVHTHDNQPDPAPGNESMLSSMELNPPPLSMPGIATSLSCSSDKTQRVVIVPLAATSGCGCAQEAALLCKGLSLLPWAGLGVGNPPPQAVKLSFLGSF